MDLTAAEWTTVLEALRQQIPDAEELVPQGATLSTTCRAIAPRLLAEMQAALRDRYGALAAPLADELLQLFVTGLIAEVLYLAYRSLTNDEKEWPDAWRQRFERGLASLATGEGTLADPAPRPRRGAVAGETRRFTETGLGVVLGRVVDPTSTGSCGS